MENEKIKVTIDRSKWRTGGMSTARTGQGHTYLRNCLGFQCCLGFVCEAAGVSDENLHSRSSPADTEQPVRDLNYPTLDCNGDEVFRSTPLACQAMSINDNATTSPKEKEEKVLALFENSPYELEFVGEFPEQDA